MQKSIAFLMGMACFLGIANAAPDASRRSMSSQMVMAAPRAVASKNQLNAMAAQNTGNVKITEEAALAVTPEEMQPADKVQEQKQKEKDACLANNIGVGNTYVWASRNSNTGDYVTMVEDFVNPENNTCFIKVELRSNDPRIDMSGVGAKYYAWDTESITCGGWVSESDMEQRILDAKKSGRVWGTIGSTVAAAGLGFGVMEAGANKMFGKKVDGQKALTGAALFKSKVSKLNNDDDKKTICDAIAACNGKWGKDPCQNIKYIEKLGDDLNCNNNQK